jgi:leader peptidase (prepilin peptidase)/N-methyltransferase
MNVVLDVGCGLAGAVTGAILYDVAARVPPHRAPSPSEDGSSGSDGDAVPVVTNGNRDAAHGQPTETDLPAPPPSRLEQLGATLVTAALFVGAALRFGPVPELAAYCVFFAGLVLLSVTDLRVGLVPRRLLYPWLVLLGIALAGASWADDDWHRFWVAAVCGVGTFVIFFVLWFAYPRGLGFGDVRLAGVIGVALGWLGLWHLYLGLLSAFFFGAVIGIVVMIVNNSGRKTRIRFAPALAAGAAVSVLWGGTIINAWMGQGS